MAWTHATIDGLTIHELVCEVQADLIRGVNERRECIGLSPLYFYYGDGTVTKTYPSAADFDGFPLLGESVAISTPLLSNLTAVQNFLTSTAPDWFFTFPSCDTYYTVSTLAAAVGLGSFPSMGSVGNFRDATLWQRMQDALDLLTYVKSYISATAASTDYIDSYLREAVSPGTEEQIWDAAKGDTPYHYTSAPVAYVGWREDWEGALRTQLWGPATWTVHTGITGTASRLVVRVRGEWLDMDMAVSYDLNGESFATSTGTGTLEDEIEVTPDFDAYGDMELVLSVSTTEPANVPWTFTATYGDGWFSEHGLGSLCGIIFAPTVTAGEDYDATFVVHDLSSELTDQS